MVWDFGFDRGMGANYGLFELDGDLSKIAYVDSTREPKTNGGAFEAGDLNLGRAIRPEFVPTKFQWDGPTKRKLPDTMHSRSMLLVSDLLKNIIERFEPNLHQFFPIDVMQGSSGNIVMKMHFLNICTRLDSVDHELSSCKFDYSLWRPDLGGSLVFNLDQIGSHHLWHDKHVHNGWMISDALHSAMVEAGITGLAFHKNQTNVEWC